MILTQPYISMNPDDNEVWKPLMFDGINLGEYLISNFGNIYDLICNKYINQRVSDTNGYVYVNLRHNDKLKSGSLLLHRLVAENFVPYKRYDQIQVNHIDGVKTNNHSYNLEWTTPKENTDHAFATGLAANNIGERSHWSKLTDTQAIKICELLSKGFTYKEILIELGLEVTPNNMDMIGNIYRGLAWKHISKNYIFPEIDQRFRVHTRQEINDICKYIELGKSNSEIYAIIYGKQFTSKDKGAKNNYELIRRIRTKQLFADISSNYNF